MCIARMAHPPTSGDLIPPARPSYQPLPAFQPEGRWGRVSRLRTGCWLKPAGHWDHPGATRTGAWSRGGSLTSLGREPSLCAALPPSPDLQGMPLSHSSSWSTSTYVSHRCPPFICRGSFGEALTIDAYRWGPGIEAGSGSREKTATDRQADRPSLSPRVPPSAKRG